MNRPAIQLPLKPELLERVKGEIELLDRLIEKESKYSEDLRKKDLLAKWLEHSAFLNFLVCASS